MTAPIGLEETFQKMPRYIPRVALVILFGLLTLGVVAFLIGISGEEPLRAWQIYLVNFVFWTGLAQAGVVFAAIYHLSRAQWGHVIRRVAEGMGVFLPIAFLLFLPLIFGRFWLFLWMHEAHPNKAAWLNATFLFSRNGIGLLLLAILSLLFLYYSLRPQLGLALERALVKSTPLYDWLTRGWQGFELEEIRCRHALHTLAPAIIVGYAIIHSLMGFDLIMSLDPNWYSTLFGAYFFMDNFYLALAVIASTAVILRRALRLDREITPSHFLDLGKLLFGFDMLILGLLFTQYIVIWYGNITEETQFVILRTKIFPWAFFSLVALIAGYLGPFIVFLNRRVKQDPFALLPMGLVIAGGIWMERYVLIVPSLWRGPAAPIGPMELLITGGFTAAAALSYLAFLRAFPVLPWPPGLSGMRR